MAKKNDSRRTEDLLLLWRLAEVVARDRDGGPYLAEVGTTRSRMQHLLDRLRGYKPPAPLTSLWLLVITGSGVESVVHGPYATAAEREREAKELYAVSNVEQDTVQGLDIVDGHPSTWCFSGAFFANVDLREADLEEA